MRLPVLVTLVTLTGLAQENRGYYRQPALHGNTLVFVAEGDLWQTTLSGGPARRLTTHLGSESRPSFSPDGRTLAFSANYEGPTEVYTMPASGGLPQRRTYDGGVANAAGWTPDGKILYATTRFSTLPNTQLATIGQDNRIQVIPLSQASQGVYSGGTLFFTRLPAPGGTNAKRYKGGLAQNLWKWAPGLAEAVPLTADYAGTSREAMAWKGRIYFLSDRDGTMNIWSMDENGRTLRQHTKHGGLDCASPTLSEGRIAYQRGADLHVLDIASGKDTLLDIELPSDFEQLRERWVKPGEYDITGHLSWSGNELILLNRGKVFVAPAKSGRFVEATAMKPARYRDAIAMPDGKNLLTLSTQSGEVELWLLAANGNGPPRQLTSDGKVLRWEAQPSPDGRWIAHQDKDGQLWMLEVATRQQKKIANAESGGNSRPMFEVRWSPDSRWLAYTKSARNLFEVLHLYNVETGVTTAATTDRFNTANPAWSADGKWLYFVSDRALRTGVIAPWGPRAPDPFYDKTGKIFALALKPGEKFPFDPATELDKKEPEKKDETKLKIEIELTGLAGRLEEVPAPAGNLAGLRVVGKRLCWLSRDRFDPAKTALECLEISNKPDNKPETIALGVRDYEVSGDGKKMLLRKQNEFYIADATVKDLKVPKALTDAKVDLTGWTFPIVPREEYRELFLDAWRLHRDYFYDRGMHGVNWRAVQDRYLPFVTRVRDRAELNDLIAQMVSELSAMHSSVSGGDLRRGADQINIASLGARLARDAAQGGYVVEHVYSNDPDHPELRSPLAKEHVQPGDVILAVDGRDVLASADVGELLRNRAGKQTLLRVRPQGKSETREVIVKPIPVTQEFDLRYHEWEYTRRVAVEKASAGRFGYLHLRAMGPRDMDAFTEHFYPVHDRQGLIIDVRHNNGGNIDPWILAKLLRRSWFWWKPRVSHPYTNMQFAFRGHIVVLCDERTASDGEAFTEGFRRLGLGPVIGKRTWGGEIWLTNSNRLADQGVASAGETGVFADGKWLIEGHGVDPDIVVDNLPHATFNGKDAQLEAALAWLEKKVREKPVPDPVTPAYPRLTSGVP
ncbi:MAG: PD40 domain-containing protein [Bryobacterales bacterium]|nr:PD40 domain-containing protein [Bryobacterales bacterium]